MVEGNVRPGRRPRVAVEIEEPRAPEEKAPAEAPQPATTFGSWLKSLGATQRAERAQREREAAQARLLPEDLAAKILEACQKERAWLVARIAVIDAELATVNERIAEARDRAFASARVIQPAPLIREGLDGSLVTIPQREVIIRGEASIAAGYGLSSLFAYRRDLEAERAGRWGQLGEIQIVRRSASYGVVPAVLSIVRSWHSRVEVGAFLAPSVRAGGQVSDAAGNPLSEAEAEDMRTLQKGRG